MTDALNEPRMRKETALSLAIRLAPQYGEVLRELQNNHFEFEPRVAAIRDRLGNYVELYEDERRLGIALCMGLFGEKEFKKLNEDSKGWTAEQQQAALDEFASEELDDGQFEIPKTDEEWKEAERQAQAMPFEEREAVGRRGGLFFSGMFGSFFNTLSLMVHGAKLTTLVPQAIAGDDTCLLKAVQIDRYLLTHHPYFRARKLEAQEQQERSKAERDFLSRLVYREQNPALRGKVRYPGLYMLFGILEACRWLNDIPHEEILDLCDTAGLDRYQNRIEDVVCVTKRLREYRRWQKTCTVSMH